LAQPRRGDGLLQPPDRRLVDAPDLEAELVVDAPEMAVARRRPQPGRVHHSNQGSQATCRFASARLREIGIHQSMGSKGDCFDNPVTESFFATLENDLLRRHSFATRQDARTAVFDYIETFYNPIRLHSTLGCVAVARVDQDSRPARRWAGRRPNAARLTRRSRDATEGPGHAFGLADSLPGQVPVR